MKEIIFNDIDELLNESTNMLESINAKETISKVKIKNLLENLRSSLEYSTQYISSLLQNPKPKIYFPYTENENDFENRVNFNLPNLKNEHPKIFELIKSLQVFSAQNDWLIKLCKATNIAKHNQALNISQNIQSEENITRISVNGLNIIDGNLGKSNIQFSGNSFNGKKMDDFIVKNGVVETIKRNEVPVEFNFEIKENQIIIIEDIEEDLFIFIKKCINVIKSYTLELKKI